jgi:hypothetical protein
LEYRVQKSIGLVKKAEKLPVLSETVMTPDANDPEATTLELDELWSFDLGACFIVHLPGGERQEELSGACLLPRLRR